MSDMPEETTDQPEPPELLETAQWDWGKWLGFKHVVWIKLCSIPGVNEINLEPAPAVPEQALSLPENHCDRCIEPPYAVLLHFRKIDMLSAGQAQVTTFFNLVAAPTIEALLEACKIQVEAFVAETKKNARSTIIQAGVRGNGQQLGPGMPKNLRFKP